MDLAEALATIDLLRGHIAALEVQLTERDAVLEQQRQELTLRDFEIARLQRMLFGGRKETLTPEELAPRFAEFRAWLVAGRSALAPRSPMAQAFDYALTHWEGLTRFLHDGRVPWTNNESERLLRHLVVGRKAWVLRGTFEGAERGCV